MNKIVIDLREHEECITEEPVEITSREDKDLARTLTESGKLEIYETRHGLHIKSSSYVGSLTSGNLQININPKINGAPFLRLLRYAYNLRNFTFFPLTDYQSRSLSFQEVLIIQLIAEARELIMRGLNRQYVPVAESLTLPRGRIDFAAIVASGGIIEAKLPCHYFQRMEDHLLNQVLMAGLMMAESLTDDLEIKQQIRRLVRIIENDVSRIQLNLNVLDKAKREINRLSSAYRPALTIIEILLTAQGIELTDIQLVKLPGFLFDMNLFYQSLLERFLKDNLPDYQVKGQKSMYGMMAYARGYNPQGKKAPVLRPDFVIYEGKQVVAVMDAKYRDLWEKDLPANMLYQLVIYALSKDGRGSATILYPTLNRSAREARIEVREPAAGVNQASVILRPVNLQEMDTVLANKGKSEYDKRRTEMAMEMVFGKV